MSKQLIALLNIICLVYSRQIKHEKIECDNFDSQLCLDLAYQYYGLNEEQLMGYHEMQRLIMSDSIECHYIYDVCPFSVPPIVGEKKECINNTIEFMDDEGNTKYYECDGVDLFSFLPIEMLGSNNNASGADIWGYQTINEYGNVTHHYAITCQADGTSVVDVTDPINPNVLAFIVSNVNGPLRNVLWRDVKTYKEFAIVSADTGAIDDHSLQIFNLTKIIQDAQLYQSIHGDNTIYNVPSNDIIIYDELGRCHNVYVNEEVGHLYAFGSNGIGGNTCGSGIHIIDINDPTNPTFISCYDDSGYVHDAQCVIYHGPDNRYFNHEICFMFTPEAKNLTIIDITNPYDITLLSSTTYFTSSYNHQGWVTSSHEYLLLDDETDEGPLPERFPQFFDKQTTHIFDITNLEKPIFANTYFSHVRTVDHNQYILDNEYSCSDDNFRGYTYQANYEFGLRILSIDNISNKYNNTLKEIAYFDVYPWKYHDNGTLVWDNIKFFGAWSVYPYFNEIGTNPDDNIYSNTTIVSTTTTGVYILSFYKEPLTGPPTMEPTNVPTTEPTVEPTQNNESNNKFEWNQWYGILIIILLILIPLLFIIFICKMCCKSQTKNKAKLIKDYENSIDNSSSKYGTYGTTVKA